MADETCPRCDGTSFPPWRMCAEHRDGWYGIDHYLANWQVCRVCAEQFRQNMKSPAAFVCSDRCARDLANQQARDRREAAGANSMKWCAHCGEMFGPARSDARFCGVRCRVAAHRR